jgi:hypothetical protein
MWGNIVSSSVGAVVLFIMSQTPRWVGRAIKTEMNGFCQEACPFGTKRESFERRLAALEAKQ